MRQPASQKVAAWSTKIISAAPPPASPWARLAAHTEVVAIIARLELGPLVTDRTPQMRRRSPRRQPGGELGTFLQHDLDEERFVLLV
jgi:hypothetical protein